jgi:hypothetical protein
MQEEIILYLREHPDGVSSLELATMFLKFKNPEPVIAHKAVAAILKNDSRCKVDCKNVWFAQTMKQHGLSLREEPFTAVYCLTDSSGKIKTLHYISLWNIFENQPNVFSSWLTNPSPQHQDLNTCPLEESNTDNNPPSKEQSISKIYQLLKNRIPVFLSSGDCSSVKQTLLQYGCYLTDDTLLLSELLAALGKSVPRPLTLESASRNLLYPVIDVNDICKASELYSEIVRGLLESLVEKGIETRSALEEIMLKRSVDYFKGKEFSLKTLQELPQESGVYGFKNKSDAFIYIGKAKNLRRRLTSYFRETDESTEKIDSIRKDAYKVITYLCGSELEAIIYEYRLIRKHKPALNSQIEINERAGVFKPLPDCIILLPHAQPGKCVLFFMRQNQKIIMKQIETVSFDKVAVITEIDTFFYKGTLPAESTDFPEMELATRWVKSNRDSINLIEVYNYSGPEELSEILADHISTFTEEQNALYTERN